MLSNKSFHFSLSMIFLAFFACRSDKVAEYDTFVDAKYGARNHIHIGKAMVAMVDLLLPGGTLMIIVCIDGSPRRTGMAKN